MLFRNIIFYTCLFAISVSYAQPQDVIPCPSITRIQQAAHKIDRAKLLDGYANLYNTYSSIPAFFENGKAWYMGINYIVAQNPNEAITKAQKIIQITSSRLTLTTQPFNYCLYRAKSKPEDPNNMTWASLTSPFINS